MCFCVFTFHLFCGSLSGIHKFVVLVLVGEQLGTRDLSMRGLREVNGLRQMSETALENMILVVILFCCTIKLRRTTIRVDFKCLPLFQPPYVFLHLLHGVFGSSFISC